MALYAQTNGSQMTSSATPVAIVGLTITIPEGVGTSALVIVNLPYPYASGTNFPGCTVGITVNGVASPVIGGFTYSEQAPASGRVPTTLVVSVPMTTSLQVVTATWSAVRGSTVVIDSPATISAFIQ